MSMRWTEEDYKAFIEKRDAEARAAAVLKDKSNAFVNIKPEKRNKYGNRKVEIDGLKFDSKHEANVYTELDMRVKAGELACVLRQVPFDLPGGIRYFADFVTITPDMRIEGVYDAKSTITRKNRVYINKKKQIKALYGIDIKEV